MNVIKKLFSKADSHTFPLQFVPAAHPHFYLLKSARSESQSAAAGKASPEETSASTTADWLSELSVPHAHRSDRPSYESAEMLLGA